VKKSSHQAHFMLELTEMLSFNLAPRGSSMSWRKRFFFVGLPVVAVLAVLYLVAQYEADFLWFQHLGFAGVFTTVLWAKVTAFIVFFFIFALTGGVNAYIARKSGLKSRFAGTSVFKSPLEVIENIFHDRLKLYMWTFSLVLATVLWPNLLVITSIVSIITIIITTTSRLAKKKQGNASSGEKGVFELQTPSPDIFTLERRLSCFWVLLVLLLSGIMGMRASNAWLILLKFMHQTQFGVADPIFSKDAGFYVYTLPVYYFFMRWCSRSLLLIIGTVLFSYYLDQAIGVQKKRIRITSYRTKMHLAVLSGLAAMIAAWYYRLKIYGLMYSTTGALRGPGYADIHAQLPAYWLLVILFILLSFSIFFLPVVKKWRWAASVLGLFLVACMGFSWIYPFVIQRYRVRPDELAKEIPYIKNNISSTRLGFGLDKAREESFPVENNMKYEDIKKNDSTIHNIRLWDNRPLIQTYKQLQEIRLYYDFKNVDMGRYRLQNKYTQVAIAARELPVGKLAGRAKTWVNNHLVYTHGYGVVMSPVNQFTPDGMPKFVVKDIPPRSTTSIAITQPEIYYGEASRGFAIVHTTVKEFDYPKGAQNVYTTYRGKGGVELSSYFRRLIYSLKFSDLNILLSGSITGRSRIMLNRLVNRRAHAIAPFLTYDKDPYIVVGADGHLYWIHDAYTTTSMFPYSQSMNNGINYIRNSIKVVLDAYNGDVSFYLMDPSDPLARTYKKMFPSLIKSAGDMPVFLKAHLRYPKDLFMKQAQMYAAYHMTDPQVFYNREDLWSIPKQVYNDRKQPILPYYIIMKLPDVDTEEFILMLPMTPSKKDNMIAWMCARCDGDNLGQLLTYTLPKDKLIYGPRQIEARINQQPSITSEMTLWGQIGTNVIRGNLLTIPIAKSFLYVEPIYLQSKEGQMPQLKRVIAIQNEQLDMGKNLDAALQAVFNAADVPKAQQKKVLCRMPTDRLPALAKKALDHYRKAQEYLIHADWGKYGEELGKIRQILQNMVSNQR